MHQKKYLLLLFVFLLFKSLGNSATISSLTSGPWSSGSTWVGGAMPTTADSVVINSSHTVGISTSATASALTVNGTLNINQITIISGSVSGNGSITISLGGALNIGGDNTFAGSFSPGTGSVTYNGSGNQIVMAGNYYILNISGSGAKTISGNSTISNSLNVQSGAAISLGGVLANLVITGTATIDGVLYYGNSLLQKITIGGNLNGAGNIDMTGGNFGHWLVLSGANNSLGTLTTSNLSGSRVVYNNAGGPQTIFPSSNYQKLEINTSGPGLANLAGSITVKDSILIRPGATFAAGSIYDITLYGNWRNDGTFLNGNGTVYFSGTTPQRIDGLVSTNFFNLTINIGAQVNVARSTTVSGTIYNSGNLTIDPSFNLSVSGLFNNSNGSNFSYSDTVSVFNNIYNSGTFMGNPNSTLKVLASVPQSIGGGQSVNTFNLLMDKNGSNLTLNSNVRIDGTLDFHSDGNIFLQGSDLILGPTTTLVNSGPGSFSGTRMIQTDGMASTTGNLVKEGTVGTQFQMNYPIGDSSFYTPVNIAVSNLTVSGIGKISMKPVYYTPPSPSHAKRFIQLFSSNITAVNDFQFMFTFGNSNADYKGSPNTVYRFTGSVPNNVAGAAVNLPAYQYGVTTSGNTFLDGEWHLEVLSSTPTVTSFSPNAGCPGDTINVIGSGFLSADSVIISSLHAAFVIKSDTLLKVVIPPGAMSSAIGVYNPFGSAASTASLTVNPPATANAGTSQTVCANNATVTLAASYGGTATGGKWTGGTGIFTPDNLTANATYSPTPAETNFGSVVLIWTVTGGCGSPSGNVMITYTPAPTANAGPDQTVCANNPMVNLNGSVTIVTGGNWISPSSGTFSPSPTTTYNPTTSDISAGSVALVLTTTGNGTCNPSSDTMKVTITPTPTANAGNDTVVCANNSSINLNGSVTVASGGSWSISSGSGTFTAASSSLSTTYNFSSTDISTGVVYLILTTTGNGLCNSVKDTVLITIASSPTVTVVQSSTTICAGQPDTLTATASGAFPFLYLWSPATSLSSTTVSNPVATPTANTTYYVNIKDANGCTNSTPAPVTINVNPTVTPSINVNIISGSNPACSGTSVGFSANVVNGGTTPAYQWMVNSSNVGVNSSTYSSTSFLDGDQIICQLTSNATCAPSTPVSSNSITMSIVSFPASNKSISPPADTLCSGSNGNISIATSENGVSYMAFMGSTSVSASVSGTGGNIILNIPNSVLLNGTNNIQIKATNACGNINLTSGSTLKKSNITAPDISASGPSQLCSSGNPSVFLTLSNNSYPKIQWYLGNSVIVGDTNSTYQVVTPSDYHVMVKDSLCSISSSSFTVNSAVAVPVVTLSNGSSYTSAICSGTGSYYQWYANGNAIYGANLSTYNIYYKAQYFVAINENGCRVVSLPVNIQNPTYDSLAKKNFLSNDSIIYIEPPLEDEEEALIYPNPAKDVFKILYHAQDAGDIVVAIYSGEGEKLVTRYLGKQSGILDIEFSSLNLTSGLYKVVIIEGNKRVVKNIQLIN